ncbi:hypothetical protein MNBD_CHLOROFLEXI01-3429 [hydrothermal vent metagenome]|uniref:Uncharacterized protein n=1 Tax=hydrothermal vent metagenome TaxID=652676 RepID=A0A3B0V9Y1_9ZZZZ
MKKKQTKLIRVGDYVAEIEVELIIADDEWSPYLSVAEAYKLDDVQQALNQEDIATASKYGQVYKLTPIAA